MDSPKERRRRAKRRVKAELKVGCGFLVALPVTFAIEALVGWPPIDIALWIVVGGSLGGFVMISAAFSMMWVGIGTSTDSIYRPGLTVRSVFDPEGFEEVPLAGVRSATFVRARGLKRRKNNTFLRVRTARGRPVSVGDNEDPVGYKELHEWLLAHGVPFDGHGAAR